MCKRNPVRRYWGALLAALLFLLGYPVFAQEPMPDPAAGPDPAGLPEVEPEPEPAIPTEPAGPPPAVVSALDREFEFASALVHKLKMPDLAEKVMDQLEVSNPGVDIKDRIRVVRAEALIARRRFKQAEDLVGEMPKDSPKAQAIMLALADGYFQIGEMERTRLYYVEFFNRFTNAVPTDPDLKRFYRESAYKYSQMLAMRNDPLAAAQMLDKMQPLISPAEEREALRQIKLEQAELILRGVRDMPAGKERDALLKKARANCDEVVWGGMDIWFGRAVTALAQADLIEGNDEKATDLLEKNMVMLRKADELVTAAGRISESPRAGARTMLGAIAQDRADLLTGPIEKREEEALRFLERGAAEFDILWKLILRVNQRDANLVKQAKANKTSFTLPGTDAQRQEVFARFEKALQDFSALLARREEVGWQTPLQKRKDALKTKIQGLITALSAYDKATGVSWQDDLLINESFAGLRHIARGMEYLDSEENRVKQAVALYVKALKEYYNVFVGYPGTDWSTVSGDRVTRIKDRLTDLTGKEVTIAAKEGGQEKIARVLIKEGHSLFGRKEYAKAAEQYVKAVNDLPEGEDAIGALANLMECDVQMKDMPALKATVFYMGERFGGNPVAAQGFLRVGKLFYDAQDPVMYQFVYEQYLAAFPDHPSAPDILFMLGEQRWKIQDYEGAVRFYNRLALRYPKTPRYLPSVNRIGWAYYQSGDFPKAIDGFLRYLAEAPAGPEKAQAKLCLADSYRQNGDHTNAFIHYQELTSWLDNRGGPYSVSLEAMRKNEQVHQQAVFFTAHCRNLMAPAGESGVAMRNEAVTLFRKFVDTYPGSTYAPAALSTMGAIHLDLGRSAEATAVYDELAAKYPNTDAGQNARLAMLRSLVEINRLSKARDVLEEMVRESGKYPEDQFLRAGLLLQEKGENEAAVLALRKVIEKIDATPQDANPARPANEQRALIALGRALAGAGQHAEAARSLQRLIDKYPRSGLFYDARFLMARSLKQQQRAADAMKILQDVFQQATNQVLITQANFDLGDIQKESGDEDAALASYQRIVLLADKANPQIRPLYRDALHHSIGLFHKKEQWRQVLANSDLYIADFADSAGAAEVRQWRSNANMNLAKGGVR